MPMDRAMLIVGGLAAVGVWALVSLVLVVKYRSDNTHLREKLQTALTTVFDYQTRYDDVFERAYPESVGKEQLTAKKPEEPKAKAETKAPGAAAPVAQADGDEDEKAPGSDGEATTLATVENVAWKLKGNNLDLQFNIKNSEPNTKSEGRVWGIAKFETADGQVLYVGSPRDINVDAGGLAKNTQRGYSYSIRFHRQRNFVFQAPAAAGAFKEIKIFVKNKQGEESSYPVAVQAAVEPPTSVRSQPPAEENGPTESKLDGASVGTPEKIYAKRRANGARKRQ